MSKDNPTAPELIEQAGRALYGERFKTALAAALNVSRDTVADWCSGRMKPRPGVWADIVKLLEKRTPEIEAATKAIKKASKSA